MLPAVPEQTGGSAYAKALDREQRQSAKTLSLLRLGGMSVVFALTLVLRYGLGDESWGRPVSIFGLYWLVAGAATLLVL